MTRNAVSSLRTLGQQIALLFLPGSKQHNKAQELVEYALLVGFIAVSVAATVPYQVTAPLSTIFNKIHTYLMSQGG